MSTPIIDARQLASMRAFVSAMFDVSCQIQRVSRTPDGLGSYTEVWNTVATVQCLVERPKGAQMIALAERISDVESYQVTFPDGTDVRASDRLLIGTRTLTVGAVYTPQSYSIFDTVFASEVR